MSEIRLPRHSSRAGNRLCARVAGVLLAWVPMLPAGGQGVDQGADQGVDQGVGPGARPEVGRTRGETRGRTAGPVATGGVGHGAGPSAERPRAVPSGQVVGPVRGETPGWTLSPAQRERVAAGSILAEGDVAPGRNAADVRAAVQIEAPPERVFRTLTDCAQALRFVPHLKRCSVLDTAHDGSWQNVEHDVDYGWLAPRAHYVFHADYEGFERIRFTHVRGDFHENEGVWELRAVKEGRATLVTYRARLVPAFFVPRWMMRSMLKRDLPELMRGLRQRALSPPAPAPKKGSPPPIP